MKKISALILLTILTTFMYLNTNTVHADALFEYDLEWSISYEEGTYLLKSQRDGIDYSHLMIELWTDTTTYDMQYALDQFIILSHNTYTTTINIYPSLHSISLTTKYDFIEDTIHQDDLLYSNDNGSKDINLSNYQNQYLEIQLVLNPNLTQAQRDAVLNYFNQKDKDPITCVTSYNLLEYPYEVKNKPSTLDNSWWHVIEGNKAYIHIAPTYKYIPYDQEVIGESVERVDSNHFNKWSLSRGVALNTLVWPETHGITKPGLEWNKLIIEVRYKDGTEELIYNGIIDHGFIIYSGMTNAERTTNTWGIKTLSFESGRALMQDDIYLNKYFSETNDKDVDAIKMYFTKDENTQIITSVNDLPSTIGTGYGYEAIEEIGLAYIEVNGTDALLTVSYQGTSYKLTYTNFNTDFLKGIYQAYYFTHNNNKILHLIYDKTPLSINEVDSNEIVTRKWTPYVHWNLSTDEIISTEKVSVLTYFKQEEAQNVYAYFYMPDIISDKLIHVDMTFDYRYYKAGFPDIWNEYPLDIQKASVSLDYDETTLTTPEWKKDLYVVTPIAMTIGAMIPVIRWPVLIIGSSLLAANYASTELNILQKEISEIESITPSLDLKNEVESSYQRMTGNPVQINTTTNKLYKLHIGQFDEKNKVEIMENSENVTNLVYEVYGQRITLEEDYIQDQFDRDENLGEGDDHSILPDFGGGILTYVILFLGIMVLINILPRLDKFLNSIFKIISNPKKLLALVFIVIILLVILKIV
jgi:hypothetical protein